jgi:hypothetical protein
LLQRVLNEAYSFFDSLLDKYDVEKIGMIGDSYIAVSGVPRWKHTDYARHL